VSNMQREKADVILVKECLSQVTLTKKSVWMSSRCAHEYMLLYKALNDLQSEKKHNNPNNDNNLPHHKQLFHFNHNLTEKTIKTYKSHRNAQDFDNAFIKKLKLDDEKIKNIQNVMSRMKTSL
jgi:hypothetical protein